MAREAWIRLLIATLLSAALHLSLIFGVVVRSPQPLGEPGSIVARLETKTMPLHDWTVGHRLSRRGTVPQTPIGRIPEPTPSPSPGLRPAVFVTPPPPQAPPAPAASPVALGSVVPLPSVDVPLLTDPTWYQAKQLDVFPRVVSSVRPAYPEEAAQTATSGEVMLELLIDESGQVHAADVVRATPEGYFEAAAVSAFQAARFVPGQKDGRPVRSRVVVKVLFRPESQF